MARRWLFASLATLLALTAIDVAFSMLFWWSPVQGHWVVPPYSSIHHPAQREWLADQRAELAGVKPSSNIEAFDAELGWRYLPGSSTDASVKARESINAIGARADREYSRAPAPGALRVVTFGDSFTHGSEVSTEDTWQRQIEDRSPALEVLNFGVGGFGTDQAFLRFRREGLHGAQAAVIGLMPENIGRNVNRYRTLWYPAATGCVAKPRLIVTDAGLEVIPIPYRTREELIDAVERGTVIADLAEHEYWSEETRMEWIRPSGLARLVAAIYAYQRRDVSHLYADPSADPYRVTREILAAFVHEAKAAGATHAAVLILPRKPDVEGHQPGWEGFWNGMESDLTSASIDVIDPIDAFIDAAYPPSGEPKVDDLFEVSHYSREGNAIVASVVAAWLERSFPEYRTLRP